MPSIKDLSDRISHALDPLRMRLSGHEEITVMASLGVLSGLLAGLVILAFRLLIETVQGQFLPGGGTENYEALDPVVRVALSVIGGLVVGVLFEAVEARTRQVGLVHVLERLAYHQGHLPFSSAVMQFLGAAVSIISGHSVGREGPGVHLGAAAGSLTGVGLRLPNNAVRTLTACGVAASIAASFNTPLAGVIFAMEVVMMEYTLYGFAPVILAAVSATTVTQLIYGKAPAFSVPPLEMQALSELPMVLLIGITIGALAATFTRSLLFFSRQLANWPFWMRTTLAGAIIGLLALPVPQIMGIGYDTVNAALLGELSLMTLGAVAGFKLIATTVGLGLGLPGGLIGPTMVIGATAGAAVAAAVGYWLPVELSHLGFYAMMGMGAMMAATLQAPLAALTAMLELTGNPNIILPGLLALITAGLSTRRLYGTDSALLLLMRARGLDYRNDPVAQHLRRIAVSAAMDRRVVLLPQQVTQAEAEAALAGQPRWVLVREGVRPVTVLAAADLARALEDQGDVASVDLLAIPADRRDVAPIALEATLQEALDTLRRSDAEVLYVTRPAAPGIPRIYGLLNQGDIEKSYQY